MKIAACIPVHNALPQFRNMMRTFKKSKPPKHSLIICDDASDDRTYQFIRKQNPARIISHGRQQWFTRSANDLIIVAYLAGADYIFLLNSDLVFLKPGWMEQMIKVLECNDKAMLAGVLYDKNSKAKPIATKFPDFVTGHCWCIKRKCIDLLGILNEHLIHIESDKEYCNRIQRFKMDALLLRTVPVGHYGGASWHHDINTLAKIKEIQLRAPRPTNILSMPDARKLLEERIGI